MRTLRILFGVAVVVALVTTGCATKKYVRENVAPVDKHVADVEKKSAETAANLTSLAEKTQKDISRVEERAMTADGKAVEAGRAAQQADSRAAQAGQSAQGAQQLAQQNQTRIGDVQRSVENIENLKVVSTEEVLFDFNKSVLTDEATAKLDQVAQSVTRLNRPQLEVEGFTDTIGSKDFNLALGRKRADAVVRYLVGKGIPLRRIHVIGLGEPEIEAKTRVTKQERQQMRRVVVRVLAP
jgi:outer membrane protein OmpA-like peptidoglycan-associated protein